MRYFEVFRVGEVIDLTPVSAGEAEMVAFARQYDPQPMHIDRDWAAQGPFGGLIASGWHTCALAMRALAEWYRREGAAVLGSPGVDSVRWLLPVRPGDVLRGKFEILSARRARTKPYGLVRQKLEFHNQDDGVVLRIVSMGIIEPRPREASQAPPSGPRS